MHIGIDARLIAYRVGGISTYTRQLVQALEKLNPEEKMTIFHSRKAPDVITSQFNTAKLMTPPHHRNERSLLSLELFRFRLDVLHSPDFIPPKGGARRHVITVHDLTFLHFPQYKDAEARRYYNDQIEMAVQQADHILAVSDATRRDLMDMLNVPAEKISVQPHGVEERFKPYSPRSLMNLGEWNLPERGYILHVGTLEPRKNIPALLDAYDMLRARMPQVPPLLLVGKAGWLFDDTMQRIQSLQAAGVPILLRDDIPDSALPAVYNQAGVLALPSFYEGFGLPALEAMACGIPVVVSDRSSLPEVVGSAGALINPDKPATLADALQRALTDSVWRQQAVDAGMKQAARFSWENSARIALSAYRG
ncbi:MAG: glycosyltransferase family 1 protein [Anaerolineae bacterium]